MDEPCMLRAPATSRHLARTISGPARAQTASRQLCTVIPQRAGQVLGSRRFVAGIFATDHAPDLVPAFELLRVVLLAQWRINAMMSRRCLITLAIQLCKHLLT